MNSNLSESSFCAALELWDAIFASSILAPSIALLQYQPKAQLENGGINQADFCRILGLDPRAVSAPSHNFRNGTDGKPNLSIQILKSLKGRFLPEDGFGRWNGEEQI